MSINYTLMEASELTTTLIHDPTYHSAPVLFALPLRLSGSGTVSLLMSAHVLLSQHSVNI